MAPRLTLPESPPRPAFPRPSQGHLLLCSETLCSPPPNPIVRGDLSGGQAQRGEGAECTWPGIRGPPGRSHLSQIPAPPQPATAAGLLPLSRTTHLEVSAPEQTSPWCSAPVLTPSPPRCPPRAAQWSPVPLRSSLLGALPDCSKPRAALRSAFPAPSCVLLRPEEGREAREAGGRRKKRGKQREGKELHLYSRLQVLPSPGT